MYKYVTRIWKRMIYPQNGMIYHNKFAGKILWNGFDSQYSELKKSLFDCMESVADSE